MRHSKGATTFGARITDSDAGSFTAIASTGSIDRDGEIIVVGAFNPLPASIPVHLDHVTTAENVVARARPYYRNGQLLIEATFGSDERSQAARRKVAEGLVDSVSVVFLPSDKRAVEGVPTIFAGSLLAVDLVSIPSNSEARILSSCGLRLAMGMTTADARATALLAMAEIEIAEAKCLLRGMESASPRPSEGPIRRHLRAQIYDVLNQPTQPYERNFDPRSH